MIVILITIGVLVSTATAIKPTVYMPKLFEFEDFDDCLGNSKGISRYCMVDVELQNKPESPLWNNIRQQSTGTFRYDKLFLGVCWNRCLNYTNDFDTLVRRNHYTGRLEDKLVIERNMEVYKRDFDRQAAAHKTINICLNHEFKRRYGLLLNSTVEYCVDEWSEQIEMGECRM